MFSDEIKNMLIQVITSWQVIAVTVVLLIYVSLVKSVARLNSRKFRPPPMPKMKKAKAAPAPAPAPAAHDDSDDIGLEEED